MKSIRKFFRIDEKRSKPIGKRSSIVEISYSLFRLQGFESFP